MEKYKNFHGFSFIKATPCPEQAGTLVEYRYDKTRTPLFYLDRPDKNMTFAIGFRTVPTDDTGVFHILEHSVLCGSEKYPVKDPFSQLLKGSISTFLNAFTYGDRTVYPVSSMNKKAFLDLVSVYLDAVLHPLAVTNENIFRQEGHRLEINDGRLERNGIVFNEMKGAYSSPDEMMAYYEGRLAFPGGCFGFDSGGNPNAIPTLTYEMFRDAHAKYYHPTNSIIYLDGEVELDPVLALIDSYLSGYGMGECFGEIPMGGEVITEPLEVAFPVNSENEETDGTRISLIRRFGAHADREGYLATALAAEAISDGNNSPLKKKILESGLCKNFSFYTVSGMKYPTLLARFTGVKDGCEDEVIALYRKTLDEILSTGIEREALEAALNSSEFSLRESDFGSYPRGLVYMSSVMEDVVCGEYPSAGLGYNELFTFLRGKLDTPYYLEALRSVFEDENEAKLILRPDVGFAEACEEKERVELDALLSSLSNEEKVEIETQGRAFALWQAEEESEEALASIPTLSICDLSDMPEPVESEFSTVLTTPTIRHKIDASGITYLDLLFDVSDVDPDELTLISLLPTCIADLPTEKRGAYEMQKRVKANLGNLTLSVLPVKRDGEAHIYFQVSLSMLESSKTVATDILSEYLYKRTFTDTAAIKNKISQLYIRIRDLMIGGAVGACIASGAAVFDRCEAAKEKTSGLAQYKLLKELSTDGDAERLLLRFKSFIDTYLTRERLTVVLTGEPDDGLVESMVKLTPTGGTVAGECRAPLLPPKSLGIAIPSTVSYATLISNLITATGSAPSGEYLTLGTMLDYELLWNEIRVKGGAYGTGFICRANSGTIGYYSYRDPSPEKSLDTYRKVTDIVRDFLAGDGELTSYIIGTVGSMDSVSTPRSKGASATLNILSGKTHEDILKLRREAIGTTKASLLTILDSIDAAVKCGVVTVAGPKEKLSHMGLDEIIEI